MTDLYAFRPLGRSLIGRALVGGHAAVTLRDLPASYRPAPPMIAMEASGRAQLRDYPGAAASSTGVWPERAFQPAQQAAAERRAGRIARLQARRRRYLALRTRHAMSRFWLCTRAILACRQVAP